MLSLSFCINISLWYYQQVITECLWAKSHLYIWINIIGSRQTESICDVLNHFLHIISIIWQLKNKCHHFTKAVSLVFIMFLEFGISGLLEPHESHIDCKLWHTFMFIYLHSSTISLDEPISGQRRSYVAHATFRVSDVIHKWFNSW